MICFSLWFCEEFAPQRRISLALLISASRSNLVPSSGCSVDFVFCSVRSLNVSEKRNTSSDHRVSPVGVKGTCKICWHVSAVTLWRRHDSFDCEFLRFSWTTGDFFDAAFYFSNLHFKISINFFLPFVAALVLPSVSFFAFSTAVGPVQSWCLAVFHTVAPTLIKNQPTPTVFICLLICYFFFFLLLSFLLPLSASLPASSRSLT